MYSIFPKSKLDMEPLTGLGAGAAPPPSLLRAAKERGEAETVDAKSASEAGRMVRSSIFWVEEGDGRFGEVSKKFVRLGLIGIDGLPGHDVRLHVFFFR
jgi:hypothetical protein